MLNTNQIYNMDCLDGLRLLDTESVHCCITSPPYWALRDYGSSGQIGMEETPDEYVSKLCAVFEEVRRVLRPDGVLWLNINDTYCGTGSKGNHRDPKNPNGRTGQKTAKNYQVAGLKKKDLIGIPWMLAFALRDMGWYLRQDIIWHKPNAMPESVKDRCVRAHEYLFLFAKSPRYYFDHKAIREVANYDGRKAILHKGAEKYAVSAIPGNPPQHLNAAVRDRWQWDNGKPLRNRRSVWSINTKPLKDAHFAAFPRTLIEPCILAGCPEGGIVLDPFMGSGTSAIAANALGRRYIGFELNPAYIEIAQKRLEKESEKA